MRVIINGQEAEIEAGTTVAMLVAHYEFQPRQVAVEINRDLVPRRSYDSTALCEGDHVEIVTLVGGGQEPSRRITGH